jgi:hypothetical protein
MADLSLDLRPMRFAKRRHSFDDYAGVERVQANECGVLPSLTPLRPLLRNVLSDQCPLGLRQRNVVFVLNEAAAITKMLDGAVHLEAVAVRLVDRITRDPKLIASHACITAAAIDVAAYRAFQLPDLGDARALGRGQCDSAFIVNVAAPVAKIFDGPLGFEAIAVIFVNIGCARPTTPDTSGHTLGRRPGLRQL